MTPLKKPPRRSLKDRGIYLLFEDVNSESMEELVEYIFDSNLNKVDYDRILLVINSPGGDLNSCFAAIEAMKGSKIPVWTLGIGLIASCGLVLFMSGKKGRRYLTPNTSILSHQWSWGSRGKQHELIAVTKEYELTTKRMINIYQEATGLDKKTIKKELLPAHDVWLSAKEAVEYGLADEVKEMPIK